MTFLIHPSVRAVILPNVPAAQRARHIIHTARPFPLNGQDLTVVPHNIWETRVLRAEGFAVPSPIGYYYDWPRDTSLVPNPFDNQRETAGALTLWQRGYCLNEIGTGKTLSAMWAADYLMKAGMIRKALVLTPLSTIERVWGDAVFTHFRGRKVAILHGTAAKRNKLLDSHTPDFYVINHEALDIICDVQKKIIIDKRTGAEIGEKFISANLRRDDIDLFIVDELGNYRSWNTKKWKLLKSIISPKTWVWGLTGTPTPNEPSDAWAQCNLITPWTVPAFFTSFKQMTMQKMTEHIWIPLENAHEIVFKAMQPSIRFERDQCFDLPPCTYSTRDVPLTDEQKKHYKEISTQLYSEVAGGKVSAVNEGVKAGKLVQIACGVVRDNDGVERAINAKPRLAVTLEVIEQAGHKVIVFVPYRAPLVALYNYLLENKVEVAMIHGDVSVGQRNSIFANFQTQKNPRVIVADAGCMSHGLTLTEANTIVWYGPEWSNDVYTQANGRITRSGQKNAQHIVHIAGCEIERRIYRRLEQRGRLQGLLLELVKQQELATL